MAICGDFIMECSLGFSYNSNPLSWLMKKKMGTQYSHVFLLFDCNGEQLVLQATRHGVNAMSYAVFQQENKVVALVALQDQDKIKKAYHYCVSMLGTPYGFLDIIAIALGIHYEDGEKTLICSEYVARALDFEPGKLPDSITPKDLQNLQQ